MQSGYVIINLFCQNGTGKFVHKDLAAVSVDWKPRRGLFVMGNQGGEKFRLLRVEDSKALAMRGWDVVRRFARVQFAELSGGWSLSEAEQLVAKFLNANNKQKLKIASETRKLFVDHYKGLLKSTNCHEKITRSKMGILWKKLSLMLHWHRLLYGACPVWFLFRHFVRSIAFFLREKLRILLSLWHRLLFFALNNVLLQKILSAAFSELMDRKDMNQSADFFSSAQSFFCVVQMCDSFLGVSCCAKFKGC